MKWEIFSFLSFVSSGAQYWTDLLCNFSIKIGFEVKFPFPGGKKKNEINNPIHIYSFFQIILSNGFIFYQMALKFHSPEATSITIKIWFTTILRLGKLLSNKLAKENDDNPNCIILSFFLYKRFIKILLIKNLYWRFSNQTQT